MQNTIDLEARARYFEEFANQECLTWGSDDDDDRLGAWLATLGKRRGISTLADFVDEKRWVAWREETTVKGEIKKMPKNPSSDGNAQVPTNPRTYGTRAKAEWRWERLKKKADTDKGGIGIVLGELHNGQHLVGIDLDSCMRGSTWADEVLDRFKTYTEISPSGNGLKLFFLMNAGDKVRLLELLGRNEKGEQLTEKRFSPGKHREAAIDTARFYAVTDQYFADSKTSRSLRLVPLADVEWFMKEFGPAYLVEKKAHR